MTFECPVWVEGRGAEFKGKVYNRDIVIYPDGVVEERAETGELKGEELKAYLNKAGEVDCLLIGTGVFGTLAMDGDAVQILERLSVEGVRVHALPTPRLLEECRDVVRGCRRVLAVIHVGFESL